MAPAAEMLVKGSLGLFNGLFEKGEGAGVRDVEF
jgi:hypothetical protein